MATTKFATIRYQALDRCFSNFGRKYDINDLVEACNEAILEYHPDSKGVVKRTVYEDIKFMQSEQGFLIDLVKIKDGRNVYYRYADHNYSINKRPLNSIELNQLKETIAILDRFKGLEQFSWIEDIKVKMDAVHKIKLNEKAIVSFEQNPYLKGLEHFSRISAAIQDKVVLKITYQGYKQTKPVSLVIHPYFLKQYNNRWFLFGLNDERKEISNLALDRIHEFNQAKFKYIETDIDFDEYFDDVIGVTVKVDTPVEQILLKISKDRWAYVQSKPIHGTQKVKKTGDDFIIIQLELQINQELINLLLGFGPDVIVLEPTGLKTQIIKKIQLMNNNYLNV